MQTQLKKTSLQPKSGFDSLVAFNDFHTINALNDISLTKREVDVLTCLMHGKSNKSIAILLSMSPRTVGTHLRNLMGKFKCHSRENLIHFIEQSNQFILFKKYYTHLLIESSFRRCSHDIARLIQGNNVSCLIAYSSKIIEKRMIESLSDYLSLSGIKIRVLALEDPDLSKDHSFQLDCISNDIVIYLLTSTPNDALLTFLQKRTAQKPGSVVILTDGQNNIQMKPSMKSVCLSLQAIYYDNIFNIIEVLLPHSKFSLEQISSAFKKSIESMRTDSVDELSQYQDTATLSRPIWHSLSIVHMFTIIGGIASICALFFSIWFAYEPEVKNQKNNINIFPIRSDFSFPKKQSYIWRSDIFKLIEDNFNTQAHENIKSVVLIGLSGAGKTTLARHYAHLQKNAVVWELNAESKSLLMQSFFDLAYAFARTPQQKTEIAFIQEIKDASTREKQLLSFIKENLRKNKNWFLIYDNVEDISSIQSLFPQDHQTWGSGQALITTQNKTIQNSPYLNHSNIIKVEEFSKIDALTLLSKILYQKPLQQLSSNQTQNIEDFLKHIPLFPLDILLAASYIKNTHATLTQYIKNVDLHSNEFEAIQESLVKQLNQNSKTRYSVVSTLLEHLLQVHSEYKDLLLLLCSFDSQHIPKDLLERYKNEFVVNEFIQLLKRNSLIENNQSSSASFVTVSMHRSVQKLGRQYLIKKMGASESKRIFLSMINGCLQYGQQLINTNNFEKMRLMVVHYEKILKQKDLLNDETKGHLEVLLGSIYSHLGDNRKAEKSLNDGLLNLKQYASKNYEKIAHAQTELCYVYRNLGDYQKARNLLEDSLLLYQNFLPKDHFKIASALTHLGKVYRYLGDYAKAIHAFERGIKIYKENDFEYHPKAVIALISLGSLYQHIGDLKKTKLLAEQCLVNIKYYDPKDYFNKAHLLVRLGEIYHYLGQAPKATELIEEGLLLYTTHFPNDYAKIGWSLKQLAHSHYVLNEYEKAQLYAKKSLALYQRHFSNNFIKIGELHIQLGKIHKKMNEYEKALTTFEKGIRLLEEKYGKHHIEIGKTQLEIGETYLLQNRLVQAEEFIQKSLTILKENNHPAQYTCYELLGDIYLKKISLAHNEKAEYKKELKEKSLYLYKKSLEVIEKNDSNMHHIKRLEQKLIL